MSFGKKVNTMALKLGQHCESYFLFKYGRFKEVIEFPSYYKTQVLGAEKLKKTTKTGKVSYKAIDKTARKKWAIDEASTILAEREDFHTLSEITSMKKSDDVSDVIVQLQAFKYLFFVDNLMCLDLSEYSKDNELKAEELFTKELIQQAYKSEFSTDFTDDASVVEKSGFSVELVQGNEENLKITTPLDLKMAEYFLQLS
jgi:hypothetical protein